MENERPENKFIKIPNDVIGILKGYHLKLYVYLLFLSQINDSDKVKVRQEVCSRRIGTASPKTVCRQMQKLQQLGYIAIEKNYSIWGLQLCNTITVVHKPTDRNYFLLPSEHISHTNLSSCAYELMLTLYMFSFSDPYAFPSFTDIRNVSHLSMRSIVEGYKQLEQEGIVKVERYNKENGSKGKNRYILLRKVERKIGKDNMARFLAWLSDRKSICSKIWNAIQNFLLGKITLEKLLSVNDGSFCSEKENTPPNDTKPLCTDVQSDRAEKETLWGKFRRKIRSVANKIADNAAVLFAKLKGVLPRSHHLLE